jgi:hypothetical protein
MESKQQELIEKLLEVCDSFISQAYVVTNGLNVSAIVLDKKIAEFLCKSMRKQYNTDSWVYLSIPQAIEYAFSSGREFAFEQLRDAQKKVEQPVDVSTLGEENGKTEELRKSDVQQETKQD